MVKASSKATHRYLQMVQRAVPPRSLVKNAIMAFLVGGTIAGIGQIVMGFFQSLGLSPKEAGPPTTATMIFLGAFLTGIGVYDRLGPVAGMGAALPVTGFANSIVSPALEFKREGYVLGLGARMFQVAGPVIVYGLSTSILIGFIFWLTTIAR